jgi:F5/8 type C domain-containing protein
VAAMYRQTQHGLPLINGYSGHTPPHYAILSIALRRGDPSVITELARGRSLVILVKQAFDPGGGLEMLVRGLPGIESHGGSSGGEMYVLPALPARRVAPDGEQWTAAVREAGRDTIEVDLGHPRVVRTIGFQLRWHYREIDRRIAIHGSSDGETWSTLWEDWTGGPALAAALIDPLEVPVRITLPDITTRYLRVHPVPPWLRRELRVYGPK